jgi:hypothetical protein
VMHESAVAVVSLPARTKSEACAAIWMSERSFSTLCSRIRVKKSLRSVFLFILLHHVSLFLHEPWRLTLLFHQFNRVIFINLGICNNTLYLARKECHHQFSQGWKTLEAICKRSLHHGTLDSSNPRMNVTSTHVSHAIYLFKGPYIPVSIPLKVSPKAKSPIMSKVIMVKYCTISIALSLSCWILPINRSTTRVMMCSCSDSDFKENACERSFRILPCAPGSRSLTIEPH